MGRGRRGAGFGEAGPAGQGVGPANRALVALVAVLVVLALATASLTAGLGRGIVGRWRGGPDAARAERDALVARDRARPTPIWPQDGRSLALAHRGGAGAPENSLAAIAASGREGADYAEIDVRLTADSQVVVFHDRRTGRLSAEGRDQPVRDLTLAELQGMPMISRGMVYRVPTLAQAIRTARGAGAPGVSRARPAGAHGLGLLLDLKTDPRHAPALLARIAGILAHEDFQNHTLVMSTDPAVVVVARRLHPDWRIGLCCRSARSLNRVEAGHTRLSFLVVTCSMAGDAVFARARQLCRTRPMPLYAGFGAGAGPGGEAGAAARYLADGASGVLGEDVRVIERAAAALR